MTRTYPRKRRTWPIFVAVGALGLCLLGTVAAIASTGDKHGTLTLHSTAAEPAPATTTPATKAAKALAPARVGAGTWQVGAEIKPGTYTTTARQDCYWARLKGFDGEFDSIIANGNLAAGEHGRLTVKKTDKGLELTGDCTWKLDG